MKLLLLPVCATLFPYLDFWTHFLFQMKDLDFFFCSFVSARLHLIRQHLINDYEQKDTQRHPLHTKLSFNVSTCVLISVLMVIWGQRSEETGVKPGELALMVLHGPFL